jgi:malate synthase
MTNPAILVDGEEIYEGIMDALVTPLLSIADIRGENENKTLVKVLCISLNQKCMVLKKLHLQLSYLNVQNKPWLTCKNFKNRYHG